MATKRKIPYRDEWRWEVDFGFDENGKRIRPRFHTEKDADQAILAWEKEVKKVGEWWARQSNQDRRLIQVTCESIKAAHQRIDTVWADWQRWQRDNNDTCVMPMPYGDVVKEWHRLKLAAGKSDRYCNEQLSVFKRFGEGRGELPIHRIPAQEVQDWILAQPTWSSTTKATHQSHFCSLWTVAKRRGWTSVDLFQRLEAIKRNPVNKAIWPNEQAKHFLAALLHLKNPALVTQVLQMFCCMRPEETTHEKFGWHLINLETKQINLHGEVAKKDDQRIVRLQPTAVAWLKVCQEMKCPLPPVNERRLVDQACEIIGLKTWDRDGLRKTCSTNLRPIYRNDYDVVKDCGNSIRTLIRNYADLHVPEEQSLAYWRELTPQKILEYIASPEWEEVLREVNSATSSDLPKPKANASAKSGN